MNSREDGSMTAEIRRIKEGEGETVAALWDEQARTDPDGGPLPAQGRRNIARMLDMAAWHERQLCLVAVEDEQILGFVCASIDAGSGLLPGLVGEIDALYVTPASRDGSVSERLAQSMVMELRERGSGTIRCLVCIENLDAQAFWQTQGFERDMVCMSLYPAG
jgi:ribosomal protein S18 acetylase RimI-like enzyme